MMTRFLLHAGLGALFLAAAPAFVVAQEAAPDASGQAELRLELFDVRDLIQETRDFPAPKLGLPTPRPAAATEVAPEKPRRTTAELVAAVRSLEGIAWGDGAEVHAFPGQLLVKQTPSALQAVRRWLEQLRADQSRLIAVDARFVTLPLKSVASFADGLHVIRPERAQAFLALAKSGQGRILSSPRITAFDGQRANITIANQVSYVGGIDVKATRGAIIGDPVVSTLTEGLALEVRGRARTDGWIDVDVAAQSADLLRPIPEVKTRFGTVQVPEVVAQRYSARGSLPPEGWAMLVGLTDVREDGTAGDPVVVLIRFKPVKLK
jgi:hypothetical protein